MNVGFRTRIYPTKEQEETLFSYCKMFHDSWNFLVAKYKGNLPKVSKFGIKDYSTTDLANDMKIVCPQRILLAVVKLYSNTVNMAKKGKWRDPKFHKYDPNKQFFYLSSVTWKIDGDLFPMPQIGNGVRCPRSKKVRVDSRIFKKNKVVEVIEPHFKCVCGEWWLSGNYKIPDIEKRENLEFLGLDWGIENFMTTSKGDFINYPKSVLREFNRISRLKHYYDKAENGSKNKNKIYKKIVKAYKRLANIKLDFIEKETTMLCKEYNIAVEDLTDAKIRKTHRNRRRIMFIAPRTAFVDKLKWKCSKFGTYFSEVNPAYTTRTCSRCGCVGEKLDTSIRTFTCKNCGFVLDRDVNAAINIAARGVCGT